MNIKNFRKIRRKSLESKVKQWVYWLDIIAQSIKRKFDKLELIYIFNSRITFAWQNWPSPQRNLWALFKNNHLKTLEMASRANRKWNNIYSRRYIKIKYKSQESVWTKITHSHSHPATRLIRWRLHLKQLQLRTQGSLFPQLPVGGHSSLEEQDFRKQHFSHGPQMIVVEAKYQRCSV